MERQKLLRLALAASFCAFGSGVAPVMAAPLLSCGTGEVCFELNYYLTGKTASQFPGDPAFSYGTLKISDITDTTGPPAVGGVHVEINLIDSYMGELLSLKVQQLWLNFVGDPGDSGDWYTANWYTNGSPDYKVKTTVDVGSKSSPPGFNFVFDFQIPSGGEVGYEPISFDLYSTGITVLEPNDFLAASQDCKEEKINIDGVKTKTVVCTPTEIYAALHIGSCYDKPPSGTTTNSVASVLNICPNGTSDSITVGAGEPKGNPQGDDDDFNVPEPGSMALFGAGLLAAGLAGRRRRRH